jgi:hypothetical protein
MEFKKKHAAHDPSCVAGTPKVQVKQRKSRLEAYAPKQSFDIGTIFAAHVVQAKQNKSRSEAYVPK